MKKKPVVALITGSARRIGAEIAKYLHANGTNVILHYHTSEKAVKKLALQLNRQRKNSAVFFQMDLTRPVEELKNFIHTVKKIWNRLDVLVNNASSFYPTYLGKVTEDQWTHLFATNVKAPFFLSQAAMPFLKKNKGCIINICDIHAKKPIKNYGIYCMAKSTLITMTHVFAKEYTPYIRVNGISPGAMIWPEGKNKLTKLQKEMILQKIPLHRQGKPIEIAELVFFLIKNADYITGQIISVDGGRSL